MVLSLNQIGANPAALNFNHELIELTPTLYKGRIRPFDVTARLWLNEVYHQTSIAEKDLKSFLTNRGDAVDFVYKLQTFGPELWSDAPLFYVGYVPFKEKLGLDLSQKRFSQNEIEKKLFQTRETNRAIMKEVFIYLFGKKTGGIQKLKKVQIGEVDPDLRLSFYDNQLKISQLPKKHPLTRFFKENEILFEGSRDEMMGYSSSKKVIEELFSLLERLDQVSKLDQRAPWKTIPSNQLSGEWLDLGVLAKNENKSSYSQRDYAYLHLAYQDVVKSKTPAQAVLLSSLLLEFYQKSFQGKSSSVQLYPSIQQLKAEVFYYKYPLIIGAIFLYACGLVVLLCGSVLGRKKTEIAGFILLLLAFVLHSFIIFLRCYILERPPVSNMFETVIYVPWIGMWAGFAFSFFNKNHLALIASSLAAIALLIVLKVTDLSASLENVQAILNSQYWLIVHVLLIVGSYGIFVLAAFLGHWYLSLNFIKNKNDPVVSKLIGQLIYVGLFMLIPGTVLGGVWAAQSWGRFWDWDPKESWAFISSCVYLVIIHAYRFNKIGDFGLAVGSIVGILSISFTWYGVNYILGTGFHSYGFGNGGELYYYGYVLTECLFLSFALYKKRILYVSAQNS